MRGVQRVGDLDAEPQHRLESERTGGESILQRRALQILHGDERSSVLLADVVDRADVRMVERRCGPGFTLKAAQGLGIARQIAGDELERHGTMQPRIFGFVDHAHPAAAELLDDAVVRERLTDQRIAACPERSRRAGLTAVVAAFSGELACGEIDRRRAEETVGTVVCGEQRTDFFFQPLVAAARVAKKGLALGRGNVERGLQQPIDVIPAVSCPWQSGWSRHYMEPSPRLRLIARSPASAPISVEPALAPNDRAKE